MLEKYQKLLSECREKQKIDNKRIHMSLEFVQGLFEMQDVNKWLTFNAMNENQIQNVQKFENHLQNLLKNLYVPDYQSENV